VVGVFCAFPAHTETRIANAINNAAFVFILFYLSFFKASPVAPLASFTTTNGQDQLSQQIRRLFCKACMLTGGLNCKGIVKVADSDRIGE
jgi:hypothetical protein